VKLSGSFEVQREAFLEAMKIGGCSPNTRRTYSNSLETLFRFLTGLGLQDVREVGAQNVRQYQIWLVAQRYRGWTVSTRQQAMRRFFEFLESTDQILLNPCTDLPAFKLPKRLPKEVLSVNEANAVLNAPNLQSPKGVRDRAILEVFYSTGIRLEEMAHLQVEDVDCARGFVRVCLGKGARDRMVPLGRKASDCVAEYLQKIRSAWLKPGNDDRALWVSSRPPYSPLKSQAIEVMVKHYGRLAGIQKRVTPHVWRHTCATHLVAKGANVAYVQRILGHSSLRTTQVYTRTSVAEVKATHIQCHPRPTDTLATDALACQPLRSATHLGPKSGPP
jgi:integrase/recombinase XerD